MNGINREELFRGNLGECLSRLEADLAKLAPKYSKGAAKAKLPIAKFCKVQPQALAVWFKDHNATGERLYRLLCCLDMLGYHVIEFHRSSAVIRNFTELIGFGLITAEEGRNITGYAQVSILHDALAGKQGVSSVRSSLMWEAWKSRRDDLQTAKVKAALEFSRLRGRLRRLRAKPNRAVRATTMKIDTVPTVTNVTTLPSIMPQGPKHPVSERDMKYRIYTIETIKMVLDMLDKGALRGAKASDFRELGLLPDHVRALQVHLNGINARFVAEVANEGGRNGT